MHERDHSKDRDYTPYLPIGKTHFVKFGDPQTLMTECAVRDCISAYADANPDVLLGRPRIPRLSFRFQRDSTMYLVVERVPLAEESVPSSEDAGAVLSWLREVPLPHSFPVCRIGGGHIKHRFFPDYEAPLTFSSVDALQRYLSRVRFAWYICIVTLLTRILASSGFQTALVCWPEDHETYRRPP
jgi:hypothetical protein